MPSRSAGRFFFIMKNAAKIFSVIVAFIALILSGCATSGDYRDEQEFSDMPWNTPQSWEGSRSLPGLSSPNY